MDAIHIPPNPVNIPVLMRECIEWYAAQKSELPSPELAARLHYRFVWIHPFIDGNGRTARLLMNLVLMKHGYPPAIISTLDRKKYYAALTLADLDKPAAFLNFIGKAIERSLIIYLHAAKSVSDTGKPDEYMTLHEATRYCDYSMEYLSLLARKGALPAVKFQRNWMTTREAIEEYKVANTKKG